MKIEFDSEEEKQKQIDFHTKMIQYHQSQVSKSINASISDTDGQKKEKPHYEGFYFTWDRYPKKVKKDLSERRFKALSSKHKKVLYDYVTRMVRGEWASKDKKFVPALAYLISSKDYLDEPEIEKPATMSQPIKYPPHQKDSVTEPIESVSDEKGSANAARIMSMLQVKSL